MYAPQVVGPHVAHGLEDVLLLIEVDQGDFEERGETIKEDIS